jgi:hypothetical protein
VSKFQYNQGGKHQGDQPWRIPLQASQPNVCACIKHVNIVRIYREKLAGAQPLAPEWPMERRS